MEFFKSQHDISKWIEYHSPDSVRSQLQVKNLMQKDLLKAINELSEVIDSNSERIKRLKDSINDQLTEERKTLYKNGILKYENLSILSKKVSEVYLMLLDIYTYGTYSMLAESEWDWRAFARHLYTMLYEHSKTVNRQLNDIMRILRTDIDETYDLVSLVKAKKEFSTFIADNSTFAKQIRVNVDAHFDGDLADRLSLIMNLSYCNVLELYHVYNSKMHAFLKELRPALVKLRLSADISYRCLNI